MSGSRLAGTGDSTECVFPVLRVSDPACGGREQPGRYPGIDVDSKSEVIDMTRERAYAESRMLRHVETSEKNDHFGRGGKGTLEEDAPRCFHLQLVCRMVFEGTKLAALEFQVGGCEFEPTHSEAEQLGVKPRVDVNGEFIVIDITGIRLYAGVGGAIDVEEVEADG